MHPDRRQKRTASLNARTFSYFETSGQGQAREKGQTDSMDALSFLFSPRVMIAVPSQNVPINDLGGRFPGFAVVRLLRVGNLDDLVRPEHFGKQPNDHQNSASSAGQHFFSGPAIAFRESRAQTVSGQVTPVMEWLVATPASPVILGQCQVEGVKICNVRCSIAPRSKWPTRRM